MSRDSPRSRVLPFFGLIFWPWALPAAPALAIAAGWLRRRGRLTEWGAPHEVAARTLLTVGLAPALLARSAWRLRQRRLLAAVALLVPFMLAGLAAFVIEEPGWRPDQGVTSAAAPTLAHPFGTTGDGADMLALIALGCRNSYLVVSVALLLVIGIGVPLGVAQASARWGRLVRLLLGGLETVPLLFGLLILAAWAALWIDAWQQQGWVRAEWQGALRSALIGLGIGMWLTPGMATLVAEKIALFRREDFIDASLASGVPLARVIWYHVLYHNSLASILILATHLAGLAVLFETSLGYLFSVGTAKLGGGFYYSLAQLLTTPEAKRAALFLQDWWLVAFPMAFIAAGVLGLTLLGDGLGELAGAASQAPPPPEALPTPRRPPVPPVQEAAHVG